MSTGIAAFRRRLAPPLAGALALLLHAVPSNVRADDTPPLRNWFNDPFFQVRDALPGCPVPLGPLTTGREMENQTHNRSERGTRCWLAGQCRLPNSFLYDPEIAEGVRARFRDSKAVRNASLWVTVQRRIVWVEGCVPRSYRAGMLEKLVESVPDVELVVVNVARDARRPVPYRTLETAQAASRK